MQKPSTELDAGGWTEYDDDDASIDIPRGACAECAREGYIVQTTAGEVVRGYGIEVAIAPKGATLLLAGKEDGSQTDDVFCDDCARSKR